ncbi:ArsR family transcriptional regulator [Streptomyces sp. b94]|uniref:ArsR family transcriptional regulator n=1 Tax=Streptomyces sp. b94 TaxID=1827634 RepID=UPI001B381797|nr:ArsR family transcriptional regulator [Streptomyces sp. b94]MBQ1097303.1 ArsR family transcriptional regulator [Streptomyces sp. b94]
MLRTPAHGTRLDILEWLKDPAAHFPPEHHADVVAHGVRVELVAVKLGVSRRAAGTHLDLLARTGLLRTGIIRGRTHYRRDEVRIAEVARMFEMGWQTGGRATPTRAPGPRRR